MSRHPLTPERLARELQMEVDDVLLTLWDIGLSYVRSPARTASVRQRGMLGRERTTSKRLAVQMAFGGDGREVTRNDLRYLRRELWLDDDHGIDSAMFYGTDETPPDQFIAVYRKTLVRLAKL